MNYKICYEDGSYGDAWPMDHPTGMGVTVRVNYKNCYAVGSYGSVRPMYHPTRLGVTVEGELQKLL